MDYSLLLGIQYEHSSTAKLDALLKREEQKKGSTTPIIHQLQTKSKGSKAVAIEQKQYDKRPKSPSTPKGDLSKSLPIRLPPVPVVTPPDPKILKPVQKRTEEEEKTKDSNVEKRILPPNRLSALIEKWERIQQQNLQRIVKVGPKNRTSEVIRNFEKENSPKHLSVHRRSRASSLMDNRPQKKIPPPLPPRRSSVLRPAPQEKREHKRKITPIGSLIPENKPVSKPPEIKISSPKREQNSPKQEDTPASITCSVPTDLEKLSILNKQSEQYLEELAKRFQTSGEGGSSPISQTRLRRTYSADDLSKNIITKDVVSERGLHKTFYHEEYKRYVVVPKLEKPNFDNNPSADVEDSRMLVGCKRKDGVKENIFMGIIDITQRYTYRKKTALLIRSIQHEVVSMFLNY